MNYERQGDRRADWWCLSLKDGLTGIPIGIFQELVSRFCGLGLDRMATEAVMQVRSLVSGHQHG